ncbi:MAG: hypothetical protein JSW72_03020 [Candidatus Bathyarchaeota archaeon]|nr:MAG: hypothetical protein JSW72_03020 [Candidatus Bathyarchaeota archaeon]
MPRVIPMARTQNAKGGDNGCSCEACGRVFEKAIELTNLSAVPQQTYIACPFCFSKMTGGHSAGEAFEPNTPDSNTGFEEQPEDLGASEQEKCSHHLGYLKKRPKNTPIPDTCLTCEKMIQCLL